LQSQVALAGGEPDFIDRAADNAMLKIKKNNDELERVSRDMIDDTLAQKQKELSKNV